MRGGRQYGRGYATLGGVVDETEYMQRAMDQSLNSAIDDANKHQIPPDHDPEIDKKIHAEVSSRASWNEGIERLKLQQVEQMIEAMKDDSWRNRPPAVMHPIQQYTPEGAKINGMVAMLKDREKGKRR